MEALSATFDWPEAADCELCHPRGLFSLSQHEFKVMAIHESQTYTLRLFIDFLSQTFIEGLSG